MNVMVDKRGVSWTPFIWMGGILLFIILAWVAINTGLFESWTSDLEIDTNTEKFSDHVPRYLQWFDYIFGGLPAWLVNTVGVNSSIVITVGMFILIFITFGDVIDTFSTFSPPVAWISAFIIAVIAANLKALVVLLSFAIGIFAFLGAFAVVAGLLASMFAFFAVNWGIGSLGPFVMRRRAFMKADEQAAKMKAGGTKLKGAIEGLQEVGEGLGKM